jgi:hypothetical protein
MASSSSSNPPPPAERAAEIVDKLPSHPSLITKTGTAILGSGLLATAISQELYVFNEETVIAVGYFILFAYIAKVRRFLFPLDSPSSSRHSSDHLYATVPGVGREIVSITPLFLLIAPFREFRDRKDADRNLSHAQTVRLPYKEWAENHIARIKGVLDGARAEHTQAVKDRIDEVGQMKDVVELTKGLFEISKVRTPPSLLMTHRSCIAAPLLQETAQLEADAFVRRQHVALAAEVKAVLDSWVRFEHQEKENEQARLVKTIVDNVLKSVSEEKTQKDVLAWAVSEVDREYPLFNWHHLVVDDW